MSQSATTTTSTGEPDGAGEVCSSGGQPGGVDLSTEQQEQNSFRDAGQSEKAEEGEGEGGRVSTRSGPTLVDSFILYEDTVGLSDHCPVCVVFQV